MNVRQLIILLSTILMVIANMLFQQISELLFDVKPDNYGKYYESVTLISPKEFTFVIWAPIFIGMIIFSIYQALPKKRNSDLLNKLLIPILLVNIFNSFSLYVTYGYNILILIGLLVGLIWAFLKVQEYKLKEQVSFWFVEFPITLFFGWITVALIVTTSQSLNYFEWNAFGLPEYFWVITLITIASSLGAYVYFKFKSLTYILVLIWAFVGVLVSLLKQEYLFTSIFILFCSSMLLSLPFFLKKVTSLN